MITYSGLLIFMVMLMPWGMNAAYEDGWRGFFQDVFPREEPAAEGGAAMPMVDIAPLVARARDTFDQPVRRISVDWPNRGNAVIRVSTAKAPHITDQRRGGNPTLVFNGGTGELLETRPGDEAVPGAFRVYNLLVNLHLARFADPTVRWLFFLFGVGGTAMVATGMLLWVSKRTQQLRGKAPGAALRLVNGLNIASLTGLLGALAAYFAANRLLPVELAARESWEIRVFFLTWLLALGHALLRPDRRGWIEQLAVNTTMWAALPLLNMTTTDSHLFSAAGWRHGALAGFDLVCLILAGVWGYVLWRVASKPPLPVGKPTSRRTARTAPAHAVEDSA
jgi:uncharacterized iron-regulated membrane protein